MEDSGRWQRRVRLPSARRVADVLPTTVNVITTEQINCQPYRYRYDSEFQSTDGTTTLSLTRLPSKSALDGLQTKEALKQDLFWNVCNRPSKSHALRRYLCILILNNCTLVALTQSGVGLFQIVIENVLLSRSSKQKAYD